MAEKTEFAGLTVLSPGESLAEDGYSFQSVNPRIIDQLLKVGARLHRHNDAPALGNPGVEAALVLTAGTIPGDTTVSVVYTLIDPLGGETLPSPVETIVTDPPLDNPSSIPDVEIEYNAGGTLPIGTYSYAIAVEDGMGGITLVGPAVTIGRDPGFASAKVTLSGLGDIVASVSGATGWRAYKSTNQGPFHYIANGVAATDVLVDDGTLCANCSEGAPVENTTGSTSGVTVTVPTSAELVASTAVRIYIGQGGDFTNPSFAEQVTTAEALAGRTYTTIAVEEGAPPDVSTCVQGASKIDPDTELLDFPFKRPVATHADLPAGEEGDIRVTLDDRTLYVHDGGAGLSAWHPITGTGTGHVIRDGTTATDMPNRGTFMVEGTGYALSDDAANGRTILSLSGGGGGGGGSFEEVFAEAIGVNTAIPDNAAAVDTPNLNVTGTGDLGTDYRVEVEFYITHSYDGDLIISLVAPDATVVQLVDGPNNLGGQVDYGTAWVNGQKVVITEEADDLAYYDAAGVGATGTPIVGRFRATGSLSTLLGLAIAGNWKLRAQDTAGGDTGTIVSWGLRFIPLTDDGSTKIVADDSTIEFRDGGLKNARLYQRPGRRFMDGIISGSESFTFEAGAGTWDASGEIPTSTALKRMRYSDVPYGTLEARWHDNFDIDFPVEYLTADGLASVGTTRFGFKDEDGNFIYVEVAPSGANLTARVIAKLADGLVRDVTGTATTPAAGLSASGGYTYAWVTFRRFRGIYVIQLWKELPRSMAEAVPLHETWTEITTDSDLRDVRVDRVFGPGHKPGAFTIEVVPVGTTGPRLFGGGSGMRFKGYLSDPEFSHEVVATAGRHEENQADEPPGFDVIASSRHLSWEYSIGFNGAFGNFLRFTREDNGMVHVQGFGGVTNGEATLNESYLPIELWPKHDVYVAAHYTDGTGGELIKISAAGQVTRQTFTATKTIGFTASYRAQWGVPAD